MKTVRRVLVTGANGFVGSALTRLLITEGYQVSMTGNARPESLVALGANWIPMPDLTEEVDWLPVLDGVEAVVHLAAIAHRRESNSDTEQALYDRVNHRATRSLAQAIGKCPHIKRFLFMSSVRVHGDPLAFPIREESPLAPVTPYDQSKVDAEMAIRECLPPESLRWGILRPAVIYGPGNRGNMAKLEGLLRKGIPVPLGLQPNRRSFLYLGNVISAIEAFLSHPAPPSGHTWVLADEEPSSTEALVIAMADAMGIRPKRLHLPQGLLSTTARLGDLVRAAGLPAPWNTEVRQKLLGDFWLDISAIKQDLGWRPPFSQEDGIRQTYQTP